MPHRNAFGANSVKCPQDGHECTGSLWCGAGSCLKATVAEGERQGLERLHADPRYLAGYAGGLAAAKQPLAGRG